MKTLSHEQAEQEAGVNRFDDRESKPGSRRRSTCIGVLAAAGLIEAVALAGCSAGQISQTAGQESAVDGNQAVINNIALRNVRMQAQQKTDFLRPGTTVDLVAVAINQSPDVADKLIGITSEIGNVTVNGDGKLPPNGTLFIGTPTGQNRTAVDAIERAATVKARVTLDKQITNGPNYSFTFTFEKAGRVSLPVPVSQPEGPPLSAERP